MRTIEPLDNNLTAPDPIPKRVHPEAQAYASIDAQTKREDDSVTVQSHEVADTRRNVQYKDMLRINALIVIPYILSFVSITTLFALEPGTDLASALESRAMMIVLTIPAVFPWVFAIYKLRAELWNYKIRFSAFVFIYALFIFPFLDMSIGLRDKGVSIIPLLFATYISSQIYVLSIVATMKDQRMVAIPTFIVILLVVAAIML